jgi:beta-mannosidase
MPGWHPDIQVVGPWRPIRLHPPPGTTLRATLQGGSGHLQVRLPGGAGRGGMLHAAGQATPLAAEGEDLVGTLTLHDPPLWWLHTNGPAERVTVHPELEGTHHDLGQVGFGMERHHVRS